MIAGIFTALPLTAYAAPTETLLTTITATGIEQASYSTANVATVSFSYLPDCGSAYLATWGWWGYGITITVAPVDGYTITKCVFYDNANHTATDSSSPFEVETTEDDKTPLVNGNVISNSDCKGIKKIEVYGYATPAHTHDFTYAADGANITATCNGAGTCDITSGTTLTISAPTGDLTADGTTTFPATLNDDYNTTAFPGTYTIVYTKDGQPYDGTPTEAGAYTASVTVGTATASVSYTVAAPTYTVTWKNSDGSDLEVDAEVEKDTLPTYDGEAPAKAEDGENVYTFAAWDDGTTTYVLGVDDLPAVTADVTYTAVFTAGKKEIIDGKYYVGGELTKGTGLVKVGNDIYYVKITGDIYKNSTLSVAESKTNGLKPQGNYFFDEEGKMSFKNGIVAGYYYVNDELQKGAGLVKIGNDFYFVKQNGAVYKDASLYVAEAKTNGLMPAGKYFFDENGKMEVKNGVFDGFYYENNEIVKGKGIVEFENNLYFVKQNGAVYTTHHLMVPEAKTNGLIEPGLYDFEDDGRLIR